MINQQKQKPSLDTQRTQKQPQLSKIVQPITKRYFHTQNTEFRLPLEFVSSKNKKYIVVQYVGAIVKDFIVGDLMVHSDLVQIDNYCDSFIMLANKRQTKYRKYEFFSTSKRDYKIWFTDLYGNKIEPSAFVLSCLLIY
ncbi:hypothetical protein M9Y10_004705 [Tritrichomonas musculus]|uniref:Uncharacterized protein n=1 Tax=Tritrichomonas musculus TaxID=1915356 RepID=A0ABR2IN87_9EUKA